MKTRLLALFAVVTVVLSVGASPALAQGSVSMEDNFFSPATVTIGVGETVTWTNNGGNTHTATGPGFDSGFMDPGDSFSFTFNSAGTFDYICEIHVGEGMVGTVIVQAGDGDGTLPPTGPSARSGPFVVIGLILLLGGATVLLALRRRRA